jgi:tRNA(Ile)-lysidine synthase
MTFDPGLILSELDDLADNVSLVIALSGGLDSMVLLESLSSLQHAGRLCRPVSALHVNHGLNPDADSWLQFCQRQCQRRGIHFSGTQVTVELQPGESLEELARRARYRVFEHQLDKDQCLVMGHHLDDQMETLLLRLNRGAGPGGLAGMPRSRELGSALLLRPLLPYRRHQLEEFARDRGLEWVEDASNANRQFDRNFWRHEVLPIIEQRFPGFRESWHKAMTLCAEADQLAEELALLDLASMATDDPRILQVQPLLRLDQVRQRNLLRHWMLKTGFAPPGWQLMQRLVTEIIVSDKPGARLDCARGSVQRFGDQLLLFSDTQEPTIGPEQWEPDSQPLLALAGNGNLRAVGAAAGQGGSPRQRLRYSGGGLKVSYTSDGGSIHLAGRPGKSLRKILQESTLPPWLRSRQPLLYADDKLVCIPGIGVVEQFAAGPGEPALLVSWEQPDLLHRQPQDD